jgi:uncharacterized phage-associated protein
MKTSDQILKIKATLIYILNHFPQGVDYIKLFKIIYFAQQDHLIKYAKPIVEDTFCALEHGPVPSFLYKALQQAEGRFPVSEDMKDFLEGIDVSETAKHIKIKTNLTPDMEELSGSNLKCLDTSIEKCKTKDSYLLSDLSHDSAWKEAYNRSLNDPEKDRITLLDIAQSGKASQEMLNIIQEHQQIKRFYRM